MFNLFRKLILIALFVLSFALYGASVQAITIDYAAMANGSGCTEADETCGEGGYDPVIAIEGGIKVEATGGADYAYLDETWIWGGGDRGGLGGLGVCQELTGGTSGHCTPSSDDNLTFNGHLEELTLTFSEEVTITQILIRNGVHEEAFLDGSQFTIDTVSTGLVYYDLVHEFNTSLTGSIFIFTPPEIRDDDTARMYIQAVTFARVPEPSTLLLLGSGLVGLGLIRRKLKI